MVPVYQNTRRLASENRPFCTMITVPRRGDRLPSLIYGIVFIISSHVTVNWSR